MRDSEILLLAIIIILVVFIIWHTNKWSVCIEQPKIHTMNGIDIAKSETLPVFLRKDDRIIVTAPRLAVSEMNIPENFDVREEYGHLGMTPVYDQGACGSCWAFSSSATFGDRIKIASNGKDLGKDDFISQHQLAACMKCGENDQLCQQVCHGNYMDDVMNYIKNTGVCSSNTVKMYKPMAINQFICFKADKNDKYKASNIYRVNAYSMSELTTKEKREYNALRIAYDIYKHGSVAATIKVFDPLTAKNLDKNFYLYKSGVYGYPWDGDPVEYDGYHAVNLIGFGEEVVKGKNVKYWILRNSWGTEWGINGYCKIVRGKNCAIIESDVWALHY